MSIGVIPWADFWAGFEGYEDSNKLLIVEQLIDNNWLFTRSEDVQYEILQHAPKYLVRHKAIRTKLHRPTVERLEKRAAGGTPARRVIVG